MFLHAVCFLISQWFGRATGLAFVTLLLLLADQGRTSANTLPPSVHERPISTASLLDGFPAFDKNVADDAAGFRNGISLLGETTSAVNARSRAGVIPAPAAETSAGESSTRTAVDGTRIPDWNGIWRDTGILFGSQIVVTGLLYIMPESVSGWSEEQKRDGLKNYADNVGHPVLDDDEFYINYILHPYWGATYYIRGRERGLDKGPSFIYSALISAMYEFGIESFFEKPSIQDLIVTPVGGSLLGALVFEPLRESIKRKQELRWYDHAALVVTDPVGLLSRGVERLFGIKSTITINYSAGHLQKFSGSATKNNRIGVLWRFPVN